MSDGANILDRAIKNADQTEGHLDQLIEIKWTPDPNVPEEGEAMKRMLEVAQRIVIKATRIGSPQ